MRWRLGESLEVGDTRLRWSSYEKTVIIKDHKLTSGHLHKSSLSRIRRSTGFIRALHRMGFGEKTLLVSTINVYLPNGLILEGMDGKEGFSFAKRLGFGPGLTPASSSTGAALGGAPGGGAIHSCDGLTFMLP